MKQLLLWMAAGLVFGFLSGCIGMMIAYQATLPDPTQDHWYDLAEILSVPGGVLTWILFNPPDGYYGDLWDNRTHTVILNAFSWMIIALLFISMRTIAKDAMSDIRTFRTPPRRLRD